MRYFHVCLRALFGAAIFGFVLASVPPATAAVYSPRQALPADTVQQFLANPAALLAQYPNGGPQMITKVRDLGRLRSGDAGRADRIAQKRQSRSGNRDRHRAWPSRPDGGKH